MNRETARFIGDIPIFYDRGLGPVLFADYAADVAARTAASAPMDVLEMAAGTGIVTRKLRDSLDPQAKLTATDLHAPMLEVAKTKFGAAEQVIFRSADATALPFDDGAFDAIVCQFGLMFFPDKDRAHREARRTLRPGGEYFFSVWDAPRHNPFPRLGLEVIERFFPGDPPQFLAFSCAEIDPIKESLIDAGFTDIVISVKARVAEVTDPATFARGFVFGSPLFEQLRERGGARPESLVEALTERLAQELGETPMRLPMQAIFYEARAA
ncbi:class I SAM-dependent methyltransferase [Methylocystis sp. SC2]|uniref:class I SAM-dependent methyltransferase n=1 Tax=Methylocystis sp. (strain SC2) TaxID=187303 RepID=UPI00027AEC1E|nr:class I SAM-dependent methyltransferase [Methylocystis sp. SC2]CCJ05687.1 Methyltransferase type 11 [Methylocystis sp. SC2]